MNGNLTQARPELTKPLDLRQIKIGQPFRLEPEAQAIDYNGEVFFRWRVMDEGHAPEFIPSDVLAIYPEQEVGAGDFALVRRRGGELKLAKVLRSTAARVLLFLPDESPKPIGCARGELTSFYRVGATTMVIWDPEIRRDPVARLAKSEAIRKLDLSAARNPGGQREDGLNADHDQCRIIPLLHLAVA